MFKCKVCNEWFESDVELVLHQETAHLNKCQKCKKAFSTMFSKERHEGKCTGLKKKN